MLALHPDGGWTGMVAPPGILSGDTAILRLEFETNAAIGDIGFKALYSVG